MCTIALRKLLSCRQIWPGFESYFYSQVILQIYSGDFYLDMRGVIGNLFNVGAILTASRVILYLETVVMYINIIVYSIYLMTHLKLFWNGSYFEILEIYQNITDDELWELIHYHCFMTFDDLEISRFIWMIVCSNCLIHLPDDQMTNVNISKTKKKEIFLHFLNLINPSKMRSYTYPQYIHVCT